MYRYTGYSVSGFDVFLWILLTAGSIGFPMVVLTICCLRKRWKNKENNDYFYDDVESIKKRGIDGPYTSTNNLDSKPAIVNNFLPQNLQLNSNQSNTEKSAHVRFKDDFSKTNKSNDESRVANNYTPNQMNITDLRNLKEASNNFLPTRLSQRGIIDRKSQQNADNNNDQGGEAASYYDSNYMSINGDKNSPAQEPRNTLPILNTISNSYRNPDRKQTIEKEREAFENLYSQVIVASDRKNPSMRVPRESSQPKNPLNEDYNREYTVIPPQPVYMNTSSYNDYLYGNDNNAE